MRRFLTFLNNEDYRVAPFCPKCLNRLYSLTLHLPHQILTVLIEDATGATMCDCSVTDFNAVSDVLPDSLQRDNAEFPGGGVFVPHNSTKTHQFHLIGVYYIQRPYHMVRFMRSIKKNPGGPQTPEVRHSTLKRWNFLVLLDFQIESRPLHVF